MGVCKPDPAAFSRMGEVSGRSIREILYFDDSLVNVEAARAMGVRAFLADHPRQIEAICREQGIG
jgi:HAD superfamily hydrolase (TIGR01509 family)